MKIHTKSLLCLSLSCLTAFSVSASPVYGKAVKEDPAAVAVIFIQDSVLAEENNIENTDSLAEAAIIMDEANEIEPVNKESVENFLFSESLLAVTKEGFVADTFNGVDAIYRPGGNDGSNATYSCAAFIKKYYLTVYHTNVNNLFSGRTPNAIGSDSFVKVNTPRIGDIAFSNTHWAIVKAVNEDGTVTLIEQNWKWQQGGQTVTKINRVVKNSSLTFFRLQSLN